jgi:hypothetical protein
MSATRTLAETLHLQGRKPEARALMEYRVQLAGLARGQDSDVAERAREELESFPTFVPWVDDLPSGGEREDVQA